MVEWPKPISHKDLQLLWGFTNLYHRFFRDCSQVVKPLTQLSYLAQSFLWTPKAEAAFGELQRYFTSVPILVHPDPSKQFIMEIDTSESSIGAILSQQTEPDQKLHPCPFFSRHFMAAEHNYDVGNQELSAIKLALEDWRHWLEGAEHLFILWIDHSNLEYIQFPKHLNSC